MLFYTALNAIFPRNLSTNTNRDNAIDLGLSNVRFDDIYATNGTIQTSDRNEKQDIEELSDAEQRVAVVAKQWNLVAVNLNVAIAYTILYLS